MKVFTMCFLGFLMASKYVNILPASGRKLLNGLVFSLLLPCLIFSQLGQAVTLQKMLDWWFIPMNVVLSSLSGSIIGFPRNIGNVPLVLIAALCRDQSNLFGDTDKCSTDGTSYISFGQWRLEVMYESNSSKYSNMVEILKSETSKGIARKSASCSKAFLLLTRSPDFTSALFQALTKDSKKNMEQAVQESYTATLAPWHGWISSAAFRVAIKLVPDAKTFMDLLREKDEDCDILREKMQILVSLLVPFLEDTHSILKEYNLDRLKSS